MTALLNAPQRAAIRYLDGPLLVLAGAGSGKPVSSPKIATSFNKQVLMPDILWRLRLPTAAREMVERRKTA